MNVLILDLPNNQVTTEAHNVIGIIGSTKVSMNDNGVAKMTLELSIDAKELIKIIPTKESRIQALAQAPVRAIKV